MLFEKLPLADAFLIRIDPRHDNRGFFARTFCTDEFSAHGLPSSFVQCNISFNRTRGTLRGMHFQRNPRPEGKLVRCTRGAAFDVIIDIRKESSTYCRWNAFELTAENRLAIYVPHGFAHGFQTLTDDTEIFYQMTEFYVPELAAGVRFNDPAVGIQWPIPDPVISDRDGSYPNFVK